MKTTLKTCEVCVVDNASKDGSLDYLRREFPSVKLFPLSQNLGFSGAYNAVIPGLEADYLVLLNFDVEVEPNWLEQAIHLLETRPKLAAVQPKLRALQDRVTLEYAGGSGGFVDRYGYPFARGRIMHHLERDTGQYDDSVPIHWASGAALIVRKSAYLACGGLDNDFFLHMEEIDLCWRFWLYGYECAVAPQGVVYHFSGAALSKERLAKMYYNHRNSLVMLLKNYDTARLLTCFVPRVLLDLLTVLISPLRREPKRSLAVMQAYAYLFSHLTSILKKRREVQAKRSVADRELDHVIFPGSLLAQVHFKQHLTFRQIVSEW